MIWSPRRLVASSPRHPCDPGHGKAGGGSRELRSAVGLLPYVVHRNDLTGGEGVSARAREGVQLLVIAFQLGQSLAHRSHETQLERTDALG